MPKITPFLWFDKEAEEAAQFYTSLFKKSRILTVTRFFKEGQEVHGMKEGSVMTVDFVLDGQRITAMNGGPGHPPTDAFSLVVDCKTQKEVDYYWKKLTQGGQEVACGWLKDKYGLSWQIAPMAVMMKLFKSRDRAKAGRAFQAMMGMKKLDIKALKRAYEGK